MFSSEFIHVLEQVQRNPRYPLTKGKFVRWENTATRNVLACACPLTQVALASGLEIEDLREADYEAETVLNFLDLRFNLTSEEASYVLTEYDNGESLLEIIARLELEAE